MDYIYRNRERGLTLVELMVAMVIGLVLMSGIVQIFIGSKVSYLTQEEMGRVQENARYALEILTKDIRMAGYMGCFGQTDVNDIVKPAFKPVGGTAFFDDPVLAYDAQSNSGTATTDWSPNLPAYFAGGQSIAGSDVIVVQRSAPFSPTLTGNMEVTNANVQLNSNPGNEIQAGDVLFISDCVNTDIFMATNVSSGGTVTIAHSSAKNTSNFLSHAYGKDARLMKMIMNGYYVGTNADGNRALYRTRLGLNGAMNTEELVEGVETLQIAYGEDLTGNGLPNRYVKANDITDADDIVSVRVGVLMYTLNEVAAQNESRSFNVAGTDVDDTGTVPTHGGDRSLRQAYSTTIKLRNRGME